MPEHSFDRVMHDGRPWWAEAGRLLFPVIAGGDGNGDGGGDGGQGGSGGGDGGGSGGSGGEPPTLEAQALAAVDKLAKGDKLTEAELGALRKVGTELATARKDAGKHRGETKTEREAREKAEKERDELRAKFKELLDPDAAKGDKDAEARAKAEREQRERDEKATRLEAENRQLRLRGLFDRTAADKQVDADLAWGYLAGKLADVDPSKEDDARKAITAALDQATKDKPGLKLKQYAGAGSGADGGSGGGGNGRPSSLSQAIGAHYGRR